MPAWVSAEERLPARVKAAYLYNLLLFVQWPDLAEQAPLRVCALAQGALARALAPMAERKALGHRILVRSLARGSDASDCHLLFIAEAEEMELAHTLQQVRGFPVLTVSDIAEFARLGGMVEFVTHERRLLLQINLAAARKAGLKISSKLLEVALKVYIEEDAKP
jgi:hypothetical protein